MTEYNDLEIEELEEISAVDNPAQPGARAVIFKRADPQETLLTPEDLKKAIAHIRARAVALGATELIPESFTKNNPEENQMTDKTPAEKELEAVQKREADLKVELTIAKAEGSFSDAERSLYVGLDEAGKEAFRKLSPAERVAKVTAASEANPVLLTTLDGETFRKNDDPRLVAMAKREETSRKELLAERVARKSEELKKRAESELKNMTGTEAVKVAVIGAIDGISDAEVRKGALALLKAANDAMSGAFRERGTSEGSGDVDAHEKLEKIAKGLREKDSKLSQWDAYALASEQNPELYAAAVSAKD